MADLTPEVLEARREAGRTTGTANFDRVRQEQGGPNRKAGLSPLIRRGELLPGTEEIVEQVDALVGQMVSDLGGDEALTGQRKAVLEAQRFNVLVLFLSLDFVARTGITDRYGKPHPLLSIVGTFTNNIRRAAVTLGLDRRARSIDTLESIVSEYDTAARPPLDVPAEPLAAPSSEDAGA